MPPYNSRNYEYQSQQADAPGEGWTGEAYEADVLPGGDSSFPKFSKRLRRSPGQCVRYRCGILSVCCFFAVADLM